MLINESTVRKIIRKILKEELKDFDAKMEKEEIRKGGKGTGIGGEAYINYVFPKNSIYRGLEIALDTDGVLYAKKTGSSKKHVPISDPKKLVMATNAVLKVNPKSGFVAKVKKELMSRKDQALKALAREGNNFNVTIDNIKFTFQSIPQKKVADKAKELVEAIDGKKDTTSTGRDLIYNNIHVPTHEKLGGSTNITITDGEFTGSFKDYYMDSNSPAFLGGGPHGAWSAWFLNACYVLTDCDDDDKSIKKHAMKRSARGCCYPNVMATMNRNKIKKDPLSHIGKKLYIIFSAKELGANDNSGSLDAPNLVVGDAMIVNQSASVKSWSSIEKELKNVTGATHMNVYLGDSISAGGNISNTAKDDISDPAAGFMKLVEIIDAVKIDDVIASL